MLMEQISTSAAFCDEDERDLVEKMILSAGDYVQAVTHMRTKALNYAGRTGEELCSEVKQSDRERRNRHNALISFVNIVNHICDFHSQPPVYTGSSARQEYGEFAIRLVSEIFANR